MRNSKLLSIAIVSLLFAIYGCSSSDDDDDDNTPIGGTPGGGAPASGIFADAEVKGMGFATISVTGQTDQYGAYDYRSGEDITFSIGGVTLGTVPGEPGITPEDFGTASTNVARFIQSLDGDDNPANGIDLTAASLALADTMISSNAFLADTADFEANTQIIDALALAGKTLIDETTALEYLATGTDSTFDKEELKGNVFVIIDHVDDAVGFAYFEDSATLLTILSTDTTGAGEEGELSEDSWDVDDSGALQLTDLDEGISTTTIRRIGSSTEMISITVSEEGSAPLPATLVIPEAITVADLGGDGESIMSKTYDMADIDGTMLGSVTFHSDGTFTDPDNETGIFEANTVVPNVVAIVDDQNPNNEVSFMIVMEGDANEVNDTATVLIADAIAIPLGDGEYDFVFEEIFLLNVTLKQTN